MTDLAKLARGASLVSTARGFVRRHPGSTCAQVAESLGVSCAVAGAVLRTLREFGDVRSRGNTRGTRYYAR